MKKISLSLLLASCVQILFGQNYGNEWINHSQDYYKIKVVENGIYRITYDYMNQQGLPVSSINPNGIQLYYRGEEKAIHMHDANQNGLLEAGDYFEFYGVKNDGVLDQALYKSSSDQPHPYTSFFSDTSVYMLTWNNAALGKRINTYHNPLYNTAYDSFINYTMRMTFEEEWYDGVQNINYSDHSVSSKGEGYMSNRISNRGREIVIEPKEFVDKGFNPTIRFKAHGKSNPDIYLEGRNHHLRIKLNGSGRILDIIKDNGYYEQDKSYEVLRSEMASQLVFDLESQASNFDNSALSIVEFNYTRSLSLLQQSIFAFRHEGRRHIVLKDLKAGTNNYFLFDIEREQRVKGDILNDSLHFNVEYKNNGEVSNYYLWDSASYRAYGSGLEPVNFLNVDPVGNYNYLIITHKKLRNAADQYATYRLSSSGGSHSVLTVNTDVLYNEFFFGNHHPLALKNFCRYYFNEQANAPEYVLLIGKGSQYHKLKEPNILEGADLVPTIGIPPSDNLLVSGLGSNLAQLSMDIPIGRIPADQEQEVLDYLSKVQEYELDLNADYKKKVLHIAGGASASENLSLRKSLQAYADIFGAKEFGGWRSLVSKSTAATVSVEHKDEIQAHINGGISLLTYFGHGSSNVLDVDIGEAKDLQNSGKYPIFYFNGCVLGNTFAQNSLCEQYLFEPNKGAIAWLASTSVGLTSYLDDYTRDFHRIAFQQDYGKSIGEWMAKTSKTYLNQGSLYNERQTTQFVLHGDPAIKLFDAQLPDYSLEETGIKVLEDALTVAQNDSLTLLLPALNFGKATDDTLTINVTVVNSSGERYYFPVDSFTGVYSKKDLQFGLSLADLNLNGLIRFDIVLDSANSIAEGGSAGELNNSFTHEYFLSLTGITPLYPERNSIVSLTQVTLKAQNADLFAGEVEYFMELDTTPKFNSPSLQRSGLQRGTFILEHYFNLLPKDSLDYFWRCRLNLPEEEGGSWNMSTFTMIFQSPKGWSQGYYSKFQAADLNSLLIDTSSRQWEFGLTTTSPLEIWTSGGNDIGRKYGRKFLTHHSYATCDWYNYDGVELMAINPDNELRYDERTNPFNRTANSFWCSAPAGFEKYYMADSTTGEYRYNTRDSITRDSLIAFLDRIPNGYHLMVKNGWTMGIENWEQDVFDAFAQFGIVGLKDQKEFYPFAIFGQKGAPLGSAQEHYADTTLAEDPTTQGFQVGKLTTARKKLGSVKSPLVGPAKKWYSAHFDTRGNDHPSDAVEYVVWGKNLKDSMVELARGTTANYTLNSIDPAQYPYMQLEVRLEDEVLRTPLQLQRWTILYDGVPEGTLDPNINFALHNDTIAQGDSLDLSIAFRNISDLDMDSVLVHYQITNDNYTYDSLIRMDSLKADQSLMLHHSFSTNQINEDIQLKVSVNPEFDQPEQTLQNNVFFKTIVVDNDKKNPILDVLFDGVHIMNNDVVHAKPVITISANDDNPFLLLDDLALFTVKLRNVLDPQFTDIDLTGPEIAFTPQVSVEKNAIIEFRPTTLKSGTYELLAQVTDRSGNAQPNEYSIRFQIVSESKISNVYPYPNPFTTQTRFVFTLTGEVIPQDMSITIMNVRGQIVKEISAAELGPLKIGNNMTDFAWDGTDNFGDKLANGVYFYKVNMGSDSEDFEHYETGADALGAFQHDLGKLYIAR